MDNFTNVCEATSQSQELDNYRPTHRKGKKLLAEKKRRARINHCLMQIRDIVCEGQDEKDTDLEKMEKAEILEKTLEVLTKLRRDYSSQSSSSFSTRKAMAFRYASGFSSCAEESIRYIQSSRLVPAEVKVQLQNHLRAITHRIETSLHTEGQGLDFQQDYNESSITSSSSSLSERFLSTIDEIREEPRISCNDSNQTQISDIDTYYIPSPIRFQSPEIRTHLSLIPLDQHPMDREEDCTTTNTSDKTMKLSFYHQQSKFSENVINDTLDNHTQIRSIDQDRCSTFNRSLINPETCFTPELCKDKPQVVTTFLSQGGQAYPLTVSTLNEVKPSTNSPVIVYSTPVISNTPSHSDQSVYNYHFYEAYPTVPSIIVQPITYMSTPLIQNHNSTLSDSEKQPRSLNSALDLCVKRNPDHQISPETMWRPW